MLWQLFSIMLHNKKGTFHKFEEKKTTQEIMKKIYQLRSGKRQQTKKEEEELINAFLQVSFSLMCLGADNLHGFGYIAFLQTLSISRYRWTKRFVQ